jgi:peptidyl-prolyl cis-trans isomerase D
MLQKMRENAQGWAAKVIIGLLIVTMALFGFGAFDFFSQANPVVASVDGHDIEENELAVAVERQRQRIIAQLGPDADPSTIDAAMLRDSVLDGLVNRTLLLAAAEDMGLAVSEAQIDEAIVGNPDFQVDGKFDRDTFRALIAGAGHTPVSFRTELANSYALAQLNEGVARTPFATEAESRALARLVSQTRDFAYLVFDPETFEANVQISDDEVREYFDSHPEEFRSPETVDVSFVQLRMADLANSEGIEVTEEDILSRYEADRATFAAAEQRRMAHILLEVGDERDEATARQQLLDARKRIEAGEPFEEVAKAMSEDAGSAPAGGDLGFLGKGTLVPEFEQAAWALAPGQISDPVVTQFGVHLIKLLDVKTTEYPSLEERREEIVASLRRSAAEEMYASKVRELDELAFDSPESLEPIADAVGLEIARQSGVARESGAGPFSDKKVRDAAFSEEVLEKGFNSRAIDLGESAVVMRLDAHHPAEQKAFASVSDDIRARLVRERAEVAGRDAAAAALARIEAGDATAVVASDAGLEWKVAARARRGARDVDSTIVRTAFELPRPTETARSVRMTDLAGNRTAIVMVTAVYEGDYAALTDDERAQLRTQWLESVGNLEFAALFDSVRDEASIKRR